MCKCKDCKLFKELRKISYQIKEIRDCVYDKKCNKKKGHFHRKIEKAESIESETSSDLIHSDKEESLSCSSSYFSSSRSSCSCNKHIKIDVDSDLETDISINRKHKKKKSKKEKCDCKSSQTDNRSDSRSDEEFWKFCKCCKVKEKDCKRKKKNNNKLCLPCKPICCDFIGACAIARKPLGKLICGQCKKIKFLKPVFECGIDCCDCQKPIVCDDALIVPKDGIYLINFSIDVFGLAQCKSEATATIFLCGMELASDTQLVPSKCFKSVTLKVVHIAYLCKGDVLKAQLCSGKESKIINRDPDNTFFQIARIK